MIKCKYDLNLIFQALADPTRRTILKNLSRKERAMTEVASPFDMSLVAVSKHVKVLERAGLVKRRWDGNFTYLKLNPEAMRSADGWMDYYRRFWEQTLDRLENYLEEIQKEKPHERKKK